MTYCTVGQVRVDPAYTGDHTDADVTAAIGAARALVDRATGDLHAPTPAVVEANVDGRGFLPLPWTPVTVTEVRVRDQAYVGAPFTSTIVLDPASYVVRDGTAHGQRPGVDLWAWLDGSSMVVRGAEPWAGGFRRLAAGIPMLVSGTFGHPAPPAGVTAATARLAALIVTGALTAADGARPPGVLQVQTEGYMVLYGADSTAETWSTGDAVADRALAPYRRRRTTRWGR